MNRRQPDGHTVSRGLPRLSRARPPRSPPDFDGGAISSDGGALLLRKAEPLTATIRQLAACFTDHRKADLVEHPLADLVAQRVYALALGSEDLDDHDDLRRDPLLADDGGQRDPTGTTRRRPRDRGQPRAGEGTLNRLELTPVGADPDSRSKEVTCHTHPLERLFVALFLQAHPTPPAHIVLDRDATDDPVHGHPLGRSFHGSYKSYCYLPRSISCGDDRLGARLRPSDIDASAGAPEQRQRIVAQIRAVWPRVQIAARADSGFGREPLMAWCEGHGVGDALGPAQDPRPVALIAAEAGQARQQFEATKQPARVFAELRHQALETWSRERRVVAQAEHLAQGADPRFVVTSPSAADRPARPLYEQDYCGRGAMEDRIKEQQLHRFADRTGAHTMRANQVRLFFSSIAYTLLDAPRRLGLAGTQLARAQGRTTRRKRLKVGAPVRVTVREVWAHPAGGDPYAGVFRRAHARRSGVRPAGLRC